MNRISAISLALWALVCGALWATCARAEVVLSNGATACTVRTSSYVMRVDTTSPGLLTVRGPNEQPLIDGVAGISLTVDGRRFEWTGQAAPHLHTLRAGPHLVEFCIENIVLTSGGDTWPGLVELHVTCQETKAYFHARFLLPAGDWINVGRWVYRRPQNHPQAVACSPSDARVALRAASAPSPGNDAAFLGASPCLAIVTTLPVGGAPRVEGRDIFLAVPVGDTPWTPGVAREAACAFVVAPDREQAADAVDPERHPLDASAITTSMGQFDGFEPRTGLYVFRAQTSPTPDPPPGLRAGSHLAISNDARPRAILVDSFDPWGGICGGVVTDGKDVPLPVRVQFGLNFPELNAEAGEPGWAALTFPLQLAPNERREIHAVHLYGGGRDHDLIYLNSLENVGGPLLYQATVSRLESFTVTSGGELTINDFRRHYRDLKIRSVSAILPTFFGYHDADDHYQALVPGEMRITGAGPFLADMTIAVRSADGQVTGTVRLWEVPCSDRTRLFTDVNLRVTKDIRLSTVRDAPLFLLRHHAFNPMAYRRFAAWVDPGKVEVGELDFTPNVAANRVLLGSHPFACLYQASNGIDQGIPCSDITGNPGFVLLDATVRVGGKAAPLGLYAFGTGANDAEHGDYARDLAVVPSQRLTVIPAGSAISYRALQTVYGDNSSDYSPMLAEREAWAMKPPRVKCTVGTVIADDPPHVKAVNDIAEFALTGGTDWMAVRVSGFSCAGTLDVQRITDGKGTALDREGPDGAPWYISWPDADGKIGYTFLVKLPADGATLHLRVTIAPLEGAQPAAPSDMVGPFKDPTRSTK